MLWHHLIGGNQTAFLAQCHFSRPRNAKTATSIMTNHHLYLSLAQDQTKRWISLPFIFVLLRWRASSKHTLRSKRAITVTTCATMANYGFRSHMCRGPNLSPIAVTLLKLSIKAQPHMGIPERFGHCKETSTMLEHMVKVTRHPGLGGTHSIVTTLSPIRGLHVAWSFVLLSPLRIPSCPGKPALWCIMD